MRELLPLQKTLLLDTLSKRQSSWEIELPSTRLSNLPMRLNSGKERLTTFQSKLPKLPKVQRSISILKTTLMLWSASSVLVAMNLKVELARFLRAWAFPLKTSISPLKSSRAAGRCVFLYQNCFCVVLMFCSWMSLLTI